MNAVEAMIYCLGEIADEQTRLAYDRNNVAHWIEFQEGPELCCDGANRHPFWVDGAPYTKGTDGCKASVAR